MKLICHKSQLSSGLAAIARAVATRPSIPVLSNVLLQADPGGLCLTSTNLELSISCHVDAQVITPGAITLPARTLIDLVGTLPSDNIDISLAEKTMTATLKCAQNQTNIKGIDAREFPLLNLPAAETMTISGIRELIAQVAFAASLDEARPVLQGVSLTLERDRLLMAATDGFRLSVRTKTLTAPVRAPISVVIPSRSLAELARVTGAGDVQMSFPDKSHVVFTASGVTITSLLIEGNFPDYTQIIPKSFSTTAALNQSDLNTAARQAEIVARDGVYGMTMSLQPGAGIHISAQSDEGYLETDIQAEVTGEPVKLSININYLKDFLTAAGAPRITMQCNRPNTPMMFRPDDNSFDHVIMPMAISNSDVMDAM